MIGPEADGFDAKQVEQTPASARTRIRHDNGGCAVVGIGEYRFDSSIPHKLHHGPNQCQIVSLTQSPQVAHLANYTAKSQFGGSSYRSVEMFSQVPGFLEEQDASPVCLIVCLLVQFVRLSRRFCLGNQRKMLAGRMPLRHMR
jgi:hypothetical protein